MSIAEVYDDNVFVRPSAAESDVIERASPSVEAEYRSGLLQLDGQYAFDAERYREHPRLNDSLARQHASTHVHYRPTRRLAVSADASYIRTSTPQELNVETGLAAERETAQRYSVTPSLSAQFNARTRGTVELGFVRDVLEGTASAHTGAVSIDTRSIAIDFRRTLRPADTAALEYHVSSFDFGSAPNQAGSGASRVSQAFVFGWDHQISRLAGVTLRAGPRLSSVGLRPELSVGVHRQLRQGEVSLTYARTESVAIGVAEPVEVERVALSLTAHPTRRLEIRAGPGIARDTAQVSGLRATVGLIDVEASTPIRNWLSLRGSYQGILEHGMLSPGESTIRHSTLSLRLVVAAPGRTASGGI